MAVELWLASGNPKKRAELQRLLEPLGIALRTPDEIDTTFAPVEDAPDFAGNARIKARELARLVHGFALADDSGLCVDALGGRPGVHSARYGGPGLDDKGRVRQLLQELADVPDERRSAHFACCLCLCGPDGDVRVEVEGRCDGVLLREPRGERGFGYDPIFVARACLDDSPPPSFAQLDAARKDRLSHRGHALRALLQRLIEQPQLLADGSGADGMLPLVSPPQRGEAPTRPVALTIAGSDSGGGAGIQADLRVFHRLGAFGTSAITALTAQNLGAVSAVHGAPAEFVTAQVDAVLHGFAVRAIKTGMLWSAAIVTAVANRLAKVAVPVVVDPVMVATSGARLLADDAIAAYTAQLLPRATLITPNLDEAAVLLGVPHIDSAGLRRAAEALRQRFGAAVLLKGGHLRGDPVDVLCEATGTIEFRHARVADVDTHGSGCMLSAAIAAALAHGAGLADACGTGLAFVHDALARRLPLHGGIRLADVERAMPRREALHTSR